MATAGTLLTLRDFQFGREGTTVQIQRVHVIYTLRSKSTVSTLALAARFPVASTASTGASTCFRVITIFFLNCTRSRESAHCPQSPSGKASDWHYCANHVLSSGPDVRPVCMGSSLSPKCACLALSINTSPPRINLAPCT